MGLGLRSSSVTEVLQISKGSRDSCIHVATPIGSCSVEGETESHTDIQGPLWEPTRLEPSTSALVPYATDKIFVCENSLGE